MEFKRIEPAPGLSNLIECYWSIRHDEEIREEKIIPDGFPEIIFHLGEPYQIKLSGNWETQTPYLFAGQIKKFFFLRNTGTGNMVGIKLKPTAPAHLFNVVMHHHTDSVVDLLSIQERVPNSLIQSIRTATDFTDQVQLIENTFRNLAHPKVTDETIADKAVSHIFSTSGLTSVHEICEQTGVGERQLERIFKRYVGLSPKFYARIIRFSYIFQLIHEEKPGWSDVVYKAGFYDQSHFIRNFKAFTGLDPSSYIFNEPSIANFFMKKEKM